MRHVQGLPSRSFSLPLLTLFLCCVAQSFTPGRLAAQPIWGSEGFDRQVALEVVKPFLDVENMPLCSIKRTMAC